MDAMIQMALDRLGEAELALKRASNRFKDTQTGDPDEFHDLQVWRNTTTSSATRRHLSEVSGVKTLTTLAVVATLLWGGCIFVISNSAASQGLSLCVPFTGARGPFGIITCSTTDLHTIECEPETAFDMAFGLVVCKGDRYGTPTTGVAQ